MNMARERTGKVGQEIVDNDRINFTINGQAYELSIGSGPDQVEPSHTLAHTLRETSALSEPKCLVTMVPVDVALCL